MKLISRKKEKEKELADFKRGYDIWYNNGIKESKFEHKKIREACADKAEQVVWMLSEKEVKENIKRAVFNTFP